MEYYFEYGFVGARTMVIKLNTADVLAKLEREYKHFGRRPSEESGV